MMPEHFIEKLKTVLGHDLPGEEAQNKMAPANRYDRIYRFIHKGKPRNSSVMMLLYPVNDDVFTVFIRRHKYEGPHSDQIGLPGGKYEKQDKDLVDTALRETREELGINTDKIDILGTISHLFIPVSNIDVLPVIGYMKSKPEFKPDNSEVKYIHEISLKELFDPENISEKIITGENYKVNAPYYSAGGNVIWGATAMMLSEFNEILKKTGYINPTSP